jgi:hypothetical protein
MPLQAGGGRRRPRSNVEPSLWLQPPAVSTPEPPLPGMRLHIGQIAAHCHGLGLSVDLGEALAAAMAACRRG